jgi:hypothetical protein
VQHNCAHYLSCIRSIVQEWVSRGKPRTSDTRHDFTQACQSLDWIVQYIMGLAPLLDDHENEQARVANPLLNWLRDLALLIRQDGRLGKPLRASEISEICANHELNIPQCNPDADEVKRNQALGKLFKSLFKDAQTLSVSGFTVYREVSQFYNFARQEHQQTLSYVFKV